VASELKALPAQLRPLFDDIAERVAARLAQPLEFYTQYAHYFFERKTNDSLPMLAYVLKRGNTSVYEWRTGIPPARVDRLEQEFADFGAKTSNQQQQADGAAEEINFDIGDATTAAAIQADQVFNHTI
jgi:hypothetical protein